MERRGITRRGALAMLFTAPLSVAIACKGGKNGSQDPAKSTAIPAAFDPARTHALAVSVLTFADPAYAGFPTEGRRDLVFLDTLRKRGVPKENIKALLDGEAKKKSILAAMREQVARVRRGDLLIVYYAGHGSTDKTGITYFAPHDAGDSLAASAWAVPDIFDALAKMDGGTALITADCCSSGALVDEAKARTLNFPCSVVASSRARESSTGHWTFTDVLISALTGDSLIDNDHDGNIDVVELGTFVEEEMAWAEGQLGSFCVLAGFPHKFALAHAPVTKPKHPRIGERLEAEWKGEWYPARIIDYDESKGFKIHYPGYSLEWEEFVPAARMRPHAPRRYAKKTTVEIEWHGKWYPGLVVDEKFGVHFVDYDGYGKEWDEWVPSARIRLPP